MAKQVRDLGRNIVLQESIGDRRQRSRLWGREALRVVIKTRGSDVVEAICLDYKDRPAEHFVTTDALERLPRLRFLKLADANISTGNSARLPKDLLWLGWHGSTKLHIPSGVYPKDLVVLDLSRSAVTESWEGWEPKEGAEKLEVLDLTSCHQLSKTPHFSSLHHIKILILRDCCALSRVDPSIELRKNLEILDLRNCGSLEELHDNIGLLSALEELLLDGCPIRKIPISRSMKMLCTLSAKSCKLLTHIPESIESLEQLRDLLLDDCESLVELPDYIGRLNSLLELSLSCTRVSCIPDTFSSSSQLRVLKVDHCPIRSLPCSLGELKWIRELSASRCVSLSGEIPFELNKLVNLSILRLDHTSITPIPESISGLPHLLTLDLEGCMNLENIPRLPISLVNVKITGAASEAIPNLTDLINLRQFEVVNYNSSPVQAQGTNTGHEFEVFLRFRGPDTRTGFTDSLYCSLVDAGIRTFRDDEKLRKGEQISQGLLEAIQQSRVSIPIFSKDYASSKWCLKELAKMVESYDTKKQMILPIFYDFSPNEVRHQTGAYEKAFSAHVKSNKFSDETIRGWRDALSRVGSLKGWDLTNNRYQGTAIKEVVSEVRQQLKIYLDVPENLVGIDDHMNEVMKLLDLSIDDVRAVGICGMGGIGKTTIAKFIYNKLQDQFECCSFLEDIREISSNSKSLKSLQRQLASDISRRNCDEISHVDGGKHILQSVLSTKKVLVLLDDVDKPEQLRDLVGDLDWFGRGSRIIITARDASVLLRMTKVFPNAPYRNASIYNVGPMNPNDALRLFCKHAFRLDFPLPHLAGLSEKIVDATGKLPLAIESIGSYLSIHTNDLGVWEEACKHLVTRKEVLDKLMISYEKLGEEHKEIFLDIACLFRGVDSRIPVHVWKARMFPANAIVHDLRLRSLIRVGDNNELLMHDLYRDLARKIIRDHSNNDIGKQSRLWCSKDAIQVLRKGKGTKDKVKAINLDHGTFRREEFEKLPNVWFLGLDNANLDGDFRGCLEDLSWLSHHGIGLLNLPCGLNLENLIVLDLSRSVVDGNWKGWDSLKEACNLEVLDLSSCHKLESTPKFPSLLRMKRLILQDCSELVAIDSSIEELKALEFLDMRNCPSLMNLPKELGSLESLVELLLDGSSIQEIPLTVNNASLEILSAKSCKSLTQLSSSHLPSRLTKLLLDGSSIREVFLTGNMANLTELSAKSCRSLTELSWSINIQLKLTKLFLDNCESLVVIPDSIGHLQSLTDLSLSGTSTIIIPESFRKLTNLEVLNIDNCPISNFPGSLWGLKKLEVITASGCLNLDGCIPPELGKLSSLRILGLDNTNVISLPATIEKLRRLHTLDLKGCKKLETLPNLPCSLVNLKVTGMSTSVTVPNLLDLVHLDELEILVPGNNADIPSYMKKFSKIRKFIIIVKGLASPSTRL